MSFPDFFFFIIQGQTLPACSSCDPEHHGPKNNTSTGLKAPASDLHLLPKGLGPNSTSSQHLLRLNHIIYNAEFSLITNGQATSISRPWNWMQVDRTLLPKNFIFIPEWVRTLICMKGMTITPAPEVMSESL